MNNVIPNTLSISELLQYLTYMLDNSSAVSRFLARKTSMSVCSSVSLMRLGLHIMPDVLHTRSEAQLVAGMHRCFLVKYVRMGKVASWLFHQVRGSSVALISFISLYKRYSLGRRSEGKEEKLGPVSACLS